MRISIYEEDTKKAEFYEAETVAMFIQAFVADAYFTGKASLTMNIDFPDVCQNDGAKGDNKR